MSQPEPPKPVTPHYTWMDSAIKEVGVAEIKGPVDNERIVGYAQLAGVSGVSDDETPWCATFVGAMLERNGIKGSKSAAARSYENWGTRLGKASYGSIVVLHRGDPKDWRGHVGFYLGEDNTHVCLLGGNQNDRVGKNWFPKSRVLGYRWPSTIALPASGPIILDRATNEPVTDR